MMLNLFTDIAKNRVFHGFLYFIMLVTLAMPFLNHIIELLSAIFIAVVSFVFVISNYTTGYITVALSVCKNE